jgi:hypothetical protein
VLAPLPEDICPIASDFRRAYESIDAWIRAAVSPALLKHRDFIYVKHLALPVRT